MQNDTFNRSEYDSPGARISPNLYNLIIGAVLGWGFLVNWLMVRNIPVESLMKINPWVFIIGYFASCFFGVYLFASSSNPVVSFIGYNFVVVPFGLIINMVVAQFSPDLVLEAILITGMVTVVMMILGTLFPVFFQKIAGVLFIALLAVILVEWVGSLFFKLNRDVVDWVVVVIFCGYIGYDWGRANRIPKTVDNAIDSAASLYIDIINLFIRILSILGRRR